jgi:hypothetical protein
MELSGPERSRALYALHKRFGEMKPVYQSYCWGLAEEYTHTLSIQLDRRKLAKEEIELIYQPTMALLDIPGDIRKENMERAIAVRDLVHRAELRIHISGMAEKLDERIQQLQ